MAKTRIERRVSGMVEQTQTDPRELIEQVRTLSEQYGVGLISDSYWIPQVLVDNLTDALDAALDENDVLEQAALILSTNRNGPCLILPNDCRDCEQGRKCARCRVEQAKQLARAEIEREKGGG